jgi:hypothetical protein
MSATGQKAKVLFAYAALAANQISLAPGQIINITSYGGHGGWSSGEEVGTGKRVNQLHLFSVLTIRYWLHISQDALDTFLRITSS